MSKDMVEITTMKAQRRPRYRRAARELPCVLTPRDLAILRLVDSFRLAASEHVQALVKGSDQGILRRLQALFHAGYLRPTPARVRPRWR